MKFLTFFSSQGSVSPSWIRSRNTDWDTCKMQTQYKRIKLLDFIWHALNPLNKLIDGWTYKKEKISYSLPSLQWELFREEYKRLALWYVIYLSVSFLRHVPFVDIFSTDDLYSQIDRTQKVKIVPVFYLPLWTHFLKLQTFSSKTYWSHYDIKITIN